MHTFIYHHIKNRPVAPRSLFHYSITHSRNNLLDSDYNLHKSNSTYFADLDVSRSHLVMHLMNKGMRRVADPRNALVHNKDGEVMKGSFSIGLGAVFCSFKREIGMLQGYEMWTRVLSWDRKWLYLVTHYVVKGKVRPVAWDGKKGKTRPEVVRNADGSLVPDFQKYVIATAVSKYVFKAGRFTVHPAIVLEASGLLPLRPGEGWMGGETGTGTPEELEDISKTSQWDWRRVEYERRQGLEMAEHFAALDRTNALFDGGEDGALGVFPLA